MEKSDCNISEIICDYLDEIQKSAEKKCLDYIKKNGIKITKKIAIFISQLLTNFFLTNIFFLNKYLRNISV